VTILAKPTGIVINPPKHKTEDMFIETIIEITRINISGSLIKKASF
jgi:hypothetical protein